jgi:hypothetical protein
MKAKTNKPVVKLRRDKVTRRAVERKRYPHLRNGDKEQKTGRYYKAFNLVSRAKSMQLLGTLL